MQLARSDSDGNNIYMVRPNNSNISNNGNNNSNTSNNIRNSGGNGGNNGVSLNTNNCYDKFILTLLFLALIIAFVLWCVFTFPLPPYGNAGQLITHLMAFSLVI
jgi:hypothetical protein